MLWHVGNLQAEVAAPLVNVKGACLEHRLEVFSPVVEIYKGDVVFEQLVEIAVAVQQFVHILYLKSLGLQRLVLLHQVKQSLLVCRLQCALDDFRLKRLNLRPLLVGEPLRIRGEAGSDSLPVSLRKRILSRKFRLEDSSVQG